MPVNEIGLYTLYEMRRQVWRRLDSYRPTDVQLYDQEVVPVSPENPDGRTTGASTGPFAIDAIYPKEEVNAQINIALREHYLDLVLSMETAFSDETEIDIVADQSEYELPYDMAMLRGLYWKDPYDTRTVVPINARTLMPLLDGSLQQESSPQSVALPSYRIQLNQFVLNPVPTLDNPGGVLVRYVKWNIYLSDDAQVIESQFAPILQECVIIAAAISLAQTKAMLDVKPWLDELARWKERLLQLVRMTLTPPNIRMYRQAVPYHRVYRS